VINAQASERHAAQLGLKYALAAGGKIVAVDQGEGRGHRLQHADRAGDDAPDFEGAFPSDGDRREAGILQRQDDGPRRGAGSASR
jgi:hypothetical protein